jgi:PAS domain S-box-containing protein
VRAIRSYAFALGALAAAVLLRLALDPILGDTLPFVTLFGAVAAAVWVGGSRAALAVAVLGYVAANQLFLPPRGQFGLRDAADFVGLAAYLFTCALIVAFGEAMRRARQRAQERGELIRVTLASIGDAVITTGLGGEVSYLNGVAATLTGWTPEAALGRPLGEVVRVVREDDRSELESAERRAVREERAVGIETRALLVSRDGTERAVEESAAPIRDELGRISGSVLILRDVEARRRLEAAQAERAGAMRQLAAIVESSDDAIVSKSLDGVIRSWNAGAEKLFGHTAASAIGRHISLVIPPDRLAEEDQIIATLRAGNRVDHFETERMHADGRRIPVSLTISPIRDDDGIVVGASKIARDVSERRKMERELRSLAADLAAGNKRKNEFLATLAHELRNPLAPLRNSLNLLRRSGSEGVNFAPALDTMERQLEQLVRLVDDLLDLNRITHDRIELRRMEVELEPLVRQAVEGALPLAESASHEIRVVAPSEAIFVLADPARVVQVFGNLLNNSCKYTPPGGVISVTIERRGELAQVKVSDTGNGIPPEKIAGIFEMFAQIDSSLGQSQGGLGIGLSLVKRLVELHGGTVEARSEGKGKGSEFVVSLPALARRSVVAPAPAAPSAGERRRSGRVLVVDDNHDAALSMATLLRITGFQASIANDGAEALAAMEKERPEIVLLDLGLPRFDGFEVCRRARGAEWGREMRIFALTGWGQDEDLRRTNEAGFDGHLVKPVDFDELLALLDRPPVPRS